MNMHVMTPATPSIITRPSLSEHAILAHFSLRQWTARKKDKSAGARTARDNNAATESVSVHKRLIAKAALAKIQTCVSGSRKEHDSLTMPWGIRGINILANAGFFAYRERMALHQSAFESAADQLAANYESLRDEARLPEPHGLGDLFNESDYPDPSRIRERFSFHVSFQPIPTRNDFRVNLPDRDLDEIKEAIEKHARDQAMEAQRSIFERAMAPLVAMAESLAAYEPGADGVRAKGAFHGTLVGNVRAMAETLPLLNVFGDQRIAALAKRMMEIASVETSDLKDSDALRADTEAKARQAVADIGETMKDFF